MKIDDTCKEILIELQKEYKEKGIEISIQELASIVESQFVIANLGFKKGIEVRLPKFGTFIRKHGLEKNRAAYELNKLKDEMSKEEFERRTLKAKLNNIAKKKKRRKEMVRMTFKKLKETPDLVGVKNKYDKVL